jgi:protein-S-isoprenylcysteine O-methyltransferase Ste14
MRENNGEHPYGHAGQLILLGVFAALWAADSFFLRLTTFLAASVPLAARLAVAMPVMAVALYLIQAGHVVIPRGARPRGVLTTGAFRYVRHPLYLGSMLCYVSLTLATLSLLSAAVLMVIVLFYDHIAGYEEQMLRERYGDDYRRYHDRTGKWRPKLGASRRGRVPETRRTSGPL